jgi:hypothetical protein
MGMERYRGSVLNQFLHHRIQIVCGGDYAAAYAVAAEKVYTGSHEERLAALGIFADLVKRGHYYPEAFGAARFYSGYPDALCIASLLIMKELAAQNQYIAPICGISEQMVRRQKKNLDEMVMRIVWHAVGQQDFAHHMIACIMKTLIDRYIVTEFDKDAYTTLMLLFNKIIEKQCVYVGMDSEITACCSHVPSDFFDKLLEILGLLQAYSGSYHQYVQTIIAKLLVLPGEAELHTQLVAFMGSHHS